MWDPQTLRVRNPHDVIFVCGGETDSPPELIKSRRDALMRICMTGDFAKFSFMKAEDVNVFAPKENYKDLLRFESDIAQISGLILLFTESAGSFAELGAFSMEEEITKRLLVVIDDKYYNEDSFIKWGPVSYLENAHGDEAVYVLDRAGVGMNVDGRPADIDVALFGPRIFDAIRQRMETAKGHSTFDPSRPGHVVRLVTGLLQDYGALTDPEILLILESLDIVITPARLIEFMISAQALGWLMRSRRGLRTFNAALDGKEALRFAFSEGAPYRDRLRWRADVVAYWRSVDPERSAAIQAARPAQ